VVGVYLAWKSGFTHYFERDDVSCMDWAFRLRKDVPTWVMILVLLSAILVIAGLQHFNIV
jgi:hypothetical protein